MEVSEGEFANFVDLTVRHTVLPQIFFFLKIALNLSHDLTVQNFYQFVYFSVEGFTDEILYIILPLKRL